MTTADRPFHPDLRAQARVLPRDLPPWVLTAMRGLGRLAPKRSRVGDVLIETVTIDATPPVSVRVHRAPGRTTPGPALVWIHGGGFVVGGAADDDVECATYARDAGLLVVSVDYRLAPAHPYPAALEDCYAALTWVAREAATLGVDPSRIAIGGASAGGGLTAQLALLAAARGEVRPAFQLLIYPMLDDRTVLRADLDPATFRVWGPRANHHGWGAYLAREPGGDGVPAGAAPARHGDLRGLPPAFVSVGTHDLFHDEDVAYARRLTEAGVACGLEIVEGAFHGFDRIATGTAVAKAFRARQAEALRTALQR